MRSKGRCQSTQSTSQGCASQRGCSVNLYAGTARQHDTYPSSEPLAWPCCIRCRYYLAVVQCYMPELIVYFTEYYWGESRWRSCVRSTFCYKLWHFSFRCAAVGESILRYIKPILQLTSLFFCQYGFNSNRIRCQTWYYRQRKGRKEQQETYRQVAEPHNRCC